MNKKSQSILFMSIVASATALSGCATTAERNLDSKLARATPIETRHDLQNESEALIKTAPGLTEQQRAQLMALRDATRKKMDSLIEESLKLRSVLIKDMVASKYDSSEVDLIEWRLNRVETQRINTLMEAVKKANSIFGRQADENERLMQGFFSDAHGSRFD